MHFGSCRSPLIVAADAAPGDALVVSDSSCLQVALVDVFLSSSMSLLLLSTGTFSEVSFLVRASRYSLSSIPSGAASRTAELVPSGMNHFCVFCAKAAAAAAAVSPSLTVDVAILT